jgi:predicted PurR-regulated permease PerM
LARTADNRRLTIDIAPAALAKVLAAIVLVWLWLNLWQLLMLVVVAVVVAIGLEPVVEWLERRRIPRWVAATGAVALLTGLIVGFFWITGASLVSQARELGSRVDEFQHRILKTTPGWIVRGIRRNGSNIPDASTIAGYVVLAGRFVVSGAIIGALALILTIYLLIEGRQTYAWLAAYAPERYRERVQITAREAQKAILGYVVGNVATSIFAAVFVLIALTLLRVPAALLLAVLAGIFDFVPVLGFICSAGPAVLLALTRGPWIAITVTGLYVLYHMIENYYIGPKVYGSRLRLSNLAVILGFAVGAEIGGVVGALLALPFAALYPVIESVWLRGYLARDAVEAHRRIEHRAEP